MSSYIVGNKTISRILTFLNNPRHSSSGLSSSVEYLLKDYNYDISTETKLNELGNYFLGMNNDAVNYRYDGNGPIQLEKFRTVPSTRIQILKSVQCLKYQCAEGFIVHTEFFRFLEELIRILACSIVDDIPEYEKAEWG